MNRFVDATVRWTPAILIGIFILVIFNAVVLDLNVVTQAYSGCWLLVAAAALTYLSRYLEARS